MLKQGVLFYSLVEAIEDKIKYVYLRWKNNEAPG